MSDDTPTPRGWQAVYQLVQDAELRTLKRIEEVGSDVKGLAATMDTHLLGHAVSEATNMERVRLAAEAATRRSTNLGRVRTFIATVLPIPAAILALITAMKVFAP